ncbi:MAG: hypothetical protein SO072_02550 [Dysosmobacter sp.]|nr:hypothetical protein [Dysosmobacter sp.]
MASSALSKAIAAAVGSSVSQARKTATKKLNSSKGSSGSSAGSSVGSAVTGGTGSQVVVQKPVQMGGGSGSGGTDWSAQVQSAMDRGASADVVEYLMNQRNEKIAANQDHYSSMGISDSDSISQAAKAYIQQKRAEQEAAQLPTGKYESFREFMGDTGYDDYADQMKSAIQASVDQAVKGYQGQIDTTNEQSDDMARQAWVAKRLAEKNLGQQLSASGYAGGMADSQKISLESNYQGQLTEIEKQRLQTVKDLEAAITNAQLTGDMQTAQQLASMLQQIESEWNSYVQSQQQMDASNYWNQKQLDNQNYWKEQELAAQNKGDAYTRALTLISQGFMPDAETLTAAGITRAAAQQKLDQQLAGQTVTGGTGSDEYTPRRTPASGGYNNGSLTTGQVKQLQQAAGGLTADQAWAQFNYGGNEYSVTNQNGNGWVYIPGMGRYSYSELEQLVNDGRVIETVNPDKMQITYTRA